jgi:hypothetical protein
MSNSGLITTDPSWTLSSWFNNAGNSGGNTTLSLDLFKLLSDKSLQFGASLGLLGYFYYTDRSIPNAFTHSLIPIGGIVASDYLGLGFIPSDIISVVGGSYIANHYYLKDYQSIENKNIIYMVGASILGGYLFKNLYNNLIYHPADTSNTIL